MKIAKNCVCCYSVNLIRSSSFLMPFIAHRIFNWKPFLIKKEWKINSVQQGGMVYSSCNTLLCLECNLIFLDIRFDNEELNRLYRNYRDKSYEQLRSKYEPGYKSINKIQNSPINYINKVETFLSPLLKSNIINILDYGGGNGNNTPFKSKNKKNIIHIYDVSKQKTCDKRIKIINKKNLLKNYNLIILSNVIEHLSYPAIVICKLKKLMNKDSILYIEVPLEKIVKKIWKQKKNDKYILAFRKKKYWHEHVNFYSKKSLIKLLDNNGFKIVKMHILPVLVYKSAEVVQIACKKH